MSLMETEAQKESVGDEIEREFEESLAAAREAEGLDPAAGGTSITDLAESEEQPEEPQETLPGFSSLSGTVKGRKPDAGTIAISNASRPVEGQYEGGDTFILAVRVRVDKVEFIDTHDSDGTIIARERRHKAKPLSVKLLSPEQVETLGL